MKRGRKTRRAHYMGSVRQRADGSYAVKLSGLDGRRGWHGPFEDMEQLSRYVADFRRRQAEQELLGIREPLQTRFDTFAERFLSNAKARLRPSSLKGEESIIRGFLIPAFGSKLLHEIRREDVTSFLADRERAKAGPATRNRALSALSALFKEAIGERLVSENPCAGIKRPKEPIRAGVRLTEEQQRKLIEASRERLYPFVLLALRTGARRSELLGLRWGQVDLDGGRVTFERTKSGKPRTLPLVPEAVSMLRGLQYRAKKLGIDSPSGRVLEVAKIPAQWNGRLALLWKRALKQAGLAYMGVHRMRSVFSTTLKRKGSDLDEIKKALGHGSLTMAARYAETEGIELEDLRARMLAPDAEAKPPISGSNCPSDVHGARASEGESETQQRLTENEARD